MSSLPANRFGLKDRSLLKVGMKADIVVFEPEKYENRASQTDPIALASGVIHLIVNGLVLIEDGNMTNLRSGKVLLKAKTLTT